MSSINNMLDQSIDSYLTQKYLIKTRGWTLKLIKTFLSEPDDVNINPMFPRRAPIYMFRVLRVLQQEGKDEFRSYMRGIKTARIQKEQRRQQARLQKIGGAA